MKIDQLKERLYAFCHGFVQSRISGLHNSLQVLRESLDSEDKSSAGDKHETGRAMIQLERESLGERLAEAERMKQVLQKINIEPKRTAVAAGSIVCTTKHSYFIAISAGEYKDGKVSIYCISVGTPIGKLLLGKSVGETFAFNGEEIKILEIL